MPNSSNKTCCLQFNQDGYVLMRNFFTDEALGEMRQSLADIFGGYAQKGEDIFATVQRLGQKDKAQFYRIYKFIARSFISLFLGRLECLPIAWKLLGSRTHIEIGSAVIFALPEDNRLTWDWH